MTTCLHQFPTVSLSLHQSSPDHFVVEQSECKTYFPTLRDALVSYGALALGICERLDQIAFVTRELHMLVTMLQTTTPPVATMPTFERAAKIQIGILGEIIVRGVAGIKVEGGRKVGMATVYGQSTRVTFDPAANLWRCAALKKAPIQSAVRTNHVPST